MSSPRLGHTREYMIERAKENWRRFRESKPGQRYQDHYHRCQRGSSGKPILRVIFSVVGGFLVVFGGIIAGPGPGPGWLLILLGLGMVAGESLSFARLIDWAEVKVRRMVRLIVVGIWSTSPASVKVLIVLTILTCAAASGYGSYRLIFGS